MLENSVFDEQAVISGSVLSAKILFHVLKKLQSVILKQSLYLFLTGIKNKMLLLINSIFSIFLVNQNFEPLIIPLNTF